MSLFGKSYKISASVIVAVLLLLITAISLLLYWLNDNPNSKWTGLFGGLAAGMIVAIIQFLMAWQDFKQTEKLKKLQLIEVLYNRASRNQYEQFIRNANRRIDVVGVTAVRFFNDFADTSSGAPENARVLLQALERGVGVRVLLPADDYIPATKKADADKVKTKYSELVKRYANLEIRCFDHTAAHSIFRIDDTCIIGPVFPELESRNTPALHVMKSSPIALNYMDYFYSEWEKAKKL